MSAQIPNKTLGQHWLYDEDSLQSMVSTSQVVAGDTILEVGPGMGPLTQKLVKAASLVVAVEFDAILAANLARRINNPSNLQVVNQDILQFDLTSLPPDYKVVANIPYYLTSKLVRVLSETPNQPAMISLLVQKEVAERLAAKPGNLSILGVTAQYYFEISLDRVVKAELFNPAPKVDSQIVVLKRRDTPLFPVVDTTGLPFDIKQFFRIVKAGFGAKRKTLQNSLSAGLHLSKDQARQLLETALIDPGLRAQNLSLDEWYSLYVAAQMTFVSDASDTSKQ